MHDSPNDFNPYVDWLEVSPSLLPANHYDLLGIPLFESRPEVIEVAADQRMKTIRTYQTGPRGKLTQQILNELTTARICLLDEDQKLAYDTKLRKGINPHIQIPVPVQASEPPVQNQLIDFGSKPSSVKAKKANIGRVKGLSTRYQIYGFAMVFGLCFIAGLMKILSGDPSADEESQIVKKDSEPPKPVPSKPVDDSGSDDPEQKPQGLKAATNNTFILTAENGASSGPNPKAEKVKEDWVVTGFQKADQFFQWELWIETPGYYEAMVKYRATTNDEFSRIQLQLGDFKKTIKMRSGTKDKSEFEEEFVILMRKPQTETLRISAEGDAGDFQLQAITVRPNRK